MSVMEQKVDALIRLVTAEDSDIYLAAKAEIEELMKQQEAVRPKRTMEPEIRRILMVLGMPEHIKGHRYSVEAIRLSAENPDLLDAITGELYPAVAKVFDTTPSRVERAIRHAIETALGRCDLDVLTEHFGNAISCTKGKPTNSEFIARVSNIVRERMNEAA